MPSCTITGRICWPRIVHSEYLSTKLAKQRADDDNLPLLGIQHHRAHIASCMAENAVPLDAPPVLGIALDGLGFGEDGTIWGGEFLWLIIAVTGGFPPSSRSRWWAVPRRFRAVGATPTRPWLRRWAGSGLRNGFPN